MPGTGRLGTGTAHAPRGDPAPRARGRKKLLQGRSAIRDSTGDRSGTGSARPVAGAGRRHLAGKAAHSSLRREASEGGARPEAVILSTHETKAAQSDYLAGRLAEHGLRFRQIDLSLGSGGAAWDDERKAAAMEAAAARGAALLAGDGLPDGPVIGIGGGTGSEIVLRVMRELPMTFPKILVTTLPFDLRGEVADNAIVVVPTLVDICGLNRSLCGVLEQAAAIAAGLAGSRHPAPPAGASVAITALGATGAAADRLVARVEAAGAEPTVFHANGYGGAALARMVSGGAFDGIVDLTPHELTRILLAGDMVPMPTRFSAAGDAGIPQIVLPGGLNFLGLGRLDDIPDDYRSRSHYRHSGHFTHVKLSRDEMVAVATALCAQLNAARGSVCLIVPLGGFSHEDRPGGAIEDRSLRDAFLETAVRSLDGRHEILETGAHISEPSVDALVMERLAPVLLGRKDVANA